jgi:predicted nucleic-acid-binding Zn-ribbon protein
MDETLYCPKCGSDRVAATAEQMFMVNTGEHYCHSVKSYDGDAKATCLDCRWTGYRQQLHTEAKGGGNG